MKSSRSSLRSNLVCAAVLALLGALSVAWVQHQGSALFYGDAAAHLNIARRLFDGGNPGYQQIGTVWLPLPHVVMMPFAMVDSWWQSGLAGAIPSAIAWVLAGTLLFALLQRLFGNAGAIAGTGVFALQPNLLYLAGCPMTEPYFLAGSIGMLLFSVRAVERSSSLDAAIAGLCGIAATMTRYEGWFLLPFVSLYLLLRGGPRVALVYSLVAGLGPGYWLAHNWIFYSDPLEFYRGLGSAKQIQNGLPYPGAHEWWPAIWQFTVASKMVLGWPLLLMSLAGALWTRAAWPLFYCALAPLYYVVNLHGGDSPIYVPEIYPFSHYNSRYALAGLPLCALLVAGLAARWPRLKFVLPVLALAWFTVRPVVVADEGRVNSEQRRAWTSQVATLLRTQYQRGTGIWMPFGDLTATLPEAGLPIAESIHQGDKIRYERLTVRPDLFLDTAWVIDLRGDEVSLAMQRMDGYALVKVISLKYSPVIEVWRRVSR
ncbi:ArnT family glycosyltransferase [Bryobacter aggregatus]|uniref:ArnT family glycosyltransferase n=1 Tax=Bryobacter aggregatus TaxID=360054 RepID=UPI001EE39FB2|nr:glycosyltransferase family 39 protein [Bryobacter aggregatus]